MNKQELVDAVAGEAGLTKADTARTVDAFINQIENALKNGDKVQLVGFGTFEVAERTASQGRNPRTGEPINIPASKMPKFKAGKGLKDAVN